MRKEIIGKIPYYQAWSLLGLHRYRIGLLQLVIGLLANIYIIRMSHL